MMKNNYEMIVDLELEEEQVSALEKALPELPDYHIAKVFGCNCIKEWNKTGGKGFQLVMPLKLKDYILEPGNVYDSVPGLVLILVRQINTFDGKRVIWRDDYGCTLKGRSSNTEYHELKRHINNLPEFHIVRVFLEQCLNSIKDVEYKTLSRESQGSDYVGTENLPSATTCFAYYCNWELFEYSKKLGKNISNLSERDSVYMDLVI